MVFEANCIALTIFYYEGTKVYKNQGIIHLLNLEISNFDKELLSVLHNLPLGIVVGAKLGFIDALYLV